MPAIVARYARMLLTAVAVCITQSPLSAYNMRCTTSADGLSSNAVLSMEQDADGFLWIGTCDGVNIADGATVTPFSVMYPGLSLSGNLIENILSSPDGRMWVQTNHGLDCVDRLNRTLKQYPRFMGQELAGVDSNGNLYLLATDDVLYAIPAGNGDKVVPLLTAGLSHMSARALRVSGDTLSLIGLHGAEQLRLNFNSKGEPTGVTGRTVLSTVPVKTAAIDHAGAMAVTTGNVLGLYDKRGTWTPLIDLSGEVERRGEPSDILRVGPNDYMISFAANGVVRVHRSIGGRYVMEDMGVKAGVFCLGKSSTQPVVWIGSDCHGLFTGFNSPYTIRSLSLPLSADMGENPVRALLLDKEKTLWIGTKGGGILRVPDFMKSNGKLQLGNGEKFTNSNSALSHNSVFAFLPSRTRPVMWIVTEEGVDYYSYADGRIHTGGKSPVLRFIHAVHEENDSTLWLSTVGNGVVRCRVSGPASSPVVSVAKIYTLGQGDIASNYFFSLTTGRDGRMLFVNRGFGVCSVEGDSLRSMSLKHEYGSKAVMDAFCAVSEDTVTWIGTGHGLLKVSPNDERLFFGLENGFINNTIHDMLKDAEGNLWISTNNGLYRFDPRSESTRIFNRQDGIDVSEFSDGAAFNADSLLLFGGVEGFVTVQRSKSYKASPMAYRPPLALQQLSIAGSNVATAGYFNTDDGEMSLSLGPDERLFAVTFSIPDFVNPSDYYYLYSLNGHDWINNGTNGTISFNQMGYGTYRLLVRYLNRITGEEGEPYVLRMELRPPWYLSTAAKVIYCLLLLAVIGLTGWFYMLRLRKKRENEMSQLEHQHREEVYEEKLRFFTNITHEFCTPLTLIYGPCERISNYPGTDGYIRKYIGVVRTNVERLNTLIQELIDFRRTETGHKVLKIRPVDVTKLCTDTAGAFEELAERNNVDFKCFIDESIVWNTDFSSLRKILNNLVSNAFKYTPVGGSIEVRTHVAGGNMLELEVYNTGKGIRPEDRERIFNRYSVLDNVEENAVKGLSTRNGLGMAICHSLVKLLGGTISIESEVGRFAKFIVRLPMQEVTQLSEYDQVVESTPVAGTPQGSSQPVQQQPAPVPDVAGAAADEVSAKRTRYTILVIDDNTEILSLLADSFTDYNVLTAQSAAEGLTYLKQSNPDLVITDVMMPGTDGLSLAKQLKTNRHTMYIPLVILSARTSIEEKVEGIESGADAYVGKPFSISYLRAIVGRLLASRASLKEYYNSSASAYEYTEGLLMERGDKEYVDRVAACIDRNLSNPDLSPEDLAADLQMSSRNLYRRFKELDMPTPNDFIKDRRMAYAVRLLLTTSMTVQEILFKVGFSNRTHFYKEFDKRYGMTPRDYRNAHRNPDAEL